MPETPSVTQNRSTDREFLVKSALICAVLILIIARCPELFTHPRFWAEEGNIYFSAVFNDPFPAHLFAPHLGYYTLYSNFAAFAAAFVPLESAPLVTTCLSLVVQLLASALVIRGRFRMLSGMTQKLLFALFIQTLGYAGSWLNIAGSQYFFGVITFLILMYDDEQLSETMAVCHGILVAVGGLTGVISCLLLPGFIYRSVTTRSKRYAAYAGILAGALAIQFMVFLQDFFSRAPSLNARFYGNDMGRLLVKTVSFQFAAPFFGHLSLTTPAMEDVGFALRRVIFALTGFDKFWSESQVVTFLVGLVMFALLAVLFYRQRREWENRCLILLLIVSIPTVSFFSVQMSGGPRYTYLPSLILVYFLLSLAGSVTAPRWTRRIALVLISMSLVSSLYEYRSSIYESVYNPAWLPWKDEVRKWRQYPRYDPAIWPPPWRLHLNK